MSTTSLNFGSRNVGATGAAQTVQLTNTGTAALSLLAITVGGAERQRFRGDRTTAARRLAAGARCTIQVTFTPTASGNRGRPRCSSPATSAEVRRPSVFPAPASPPDQLPPFRRSSIPGDIRRVLHRGLWVTIGGTNLAGPPQTWNLNGVQELPVTLGGTTVTFNGVPAALLYVSPTQINALVPASVAPGKVQVVVQVNGVSSTPFTITAQAAQPAVYAPPNADGSTFFVTAALAGTATLVGNSATDPRVARPVYPGDTLDLYMIGLGSTLDPSKFITDQDILGRISSERTCYGNSGRGTGKRRVRRADVARSLSGADRGAVGSGGREPKPFQVSAGGIQTRSSLVLQMAAAPSR